MALLFVVPACKCQAALDLCHRDVGHQGRDRTYSLLQERFWWPKMRMQMMMALQNYKKCKIYEKKDPKAPLCTGRRNKAHGPRTHRFSRDGGHH